MILNAPAASLGLCLAAALLTSCHPGPSRVSSSEEAPAFRTSHLERAREIAAGLSLEAACGQLVMTGIGGRGELDAGSRLLLEEVPAGAVILFGFNIPREAADLRPALDQAQEAARNGGAGIPLFVAVDHEGGEVFRFREGITRLPSARVLGESGLETAARAGGTAGRELRTLGVSLNLAPVVEAGDADSGGFLGSRVFSRNPIQAGALAAAFLAAQQEEGTAAAAKHYPGNGAADPHKSTPAVAASLGEIEDVFDPPFRAAVKAGVAAVMLSHARFSALDPDKPASLSPAVIGRLKDRLGFQGLVLTDDLAMKALSGEGGVGAAAVAAVRAGADMVMASDGPAARQAYRSLLEAARSGILPETRVRDAASRILAQKLRFGLL